MRISDWSSDVCSSDLKGRILLALLGMAIVAGTTAAFTQLIKPVVNEIFIARQATLLYPIALAPVVVFVLRGFAAYSQVWLMHPVGQDRKSVGRGKCV